MKHDPHSRDDLRPSRLLRHLADLRAFAEKHPLSDVPPVALALVALRPLFTRMGRVKTRIEEHIYTLH